MLSNTGSGFVRLSSAESLTLYAVLNRVSSDLTKSISSEHGVSSNILCVVTGGWVVSVIDGVVGAAVGSVVSKAAVVSGLVVSGIGGVVGAAVGAVGTVVSKAAVVSGSSVGTAASVPCVVSVQKNDCF